MHLQASRFAYMGNGYVPGQSHVCAICIGCTSRAHHFDSLNFSRSLARTPSVSSLPIAYAFFVVTWLQSESIHVGARNNSDYVNQFVHQPLYR